MIILLFSNIGCWELDLGENHGVIMDKLIIEDKIYLMVTKRLTIKQLRKIFIKFKYEELKELKNGNRKPIK
jgi:hypothetical protein